MSSVWSSVSHSPSVRTAANAASMRPLSSLVYQSRAVAPLSEPDLHQLITSSQTRNRKEGVTGLLIYDEGRFLQWLEGPTEGLGRVWQSISQDRRHRGISVLGEQAVPVRSFGNSAMTLGKRRGDRADDGKRGELGLPAELIETLYQSPQTAPSMLATLAPHAADTALPHPRPTRALSKAGRMSLKALVSSVIVPQLLAKHARPALTGVAIDAHVAELAQLLLAAEPGAAFALIDVLRADGRSITQLCGSLFEPAARALGDLWSSDDCSEFEVTLGLGHLQLALRRISLETSSFDLPARPVSVPHAVLVAPSPHEPHLLGSVIASEMFWRAGWDVRCEFPDSDEALGQLVRDRWFDVLDLSLSGVFTREHRLPAMAASIRAAHAHSLNPALTVIVDGRVFHEQPLAFASVGADAGIASAWDIAPAAFADRMGDGHAGRATTREGSRFDESLQQEAGAAARQSARHAADDRVGR